MCSVSFTPACRLRCTREKLASLNLDLALVPLQINQFNECKSNLRLLEIGTCGVPIIATDIEPYRCGLPVMLVENRFKDWMNAVQAYINDPLLRQRDGDALRDAVLNHWYLRDAGLDDWRQSWLPSEHKEKRRCKAPFFRQVSVFSSNQRNRLYQTTMRFAVPR